MASGAYKAENSKQNDVTIQSINVVSTGTKKLILNLVCLLNKFLN